MGFNTMKNEDFTLINNLTDNQLSMLNALSEQNDIPKKMYYGAILVLRNEENPERLVQSAHSIRELIEKIPKYLNTSLINDSDSDHAEYNLKQQVNELQDSWRKNVQNHPLFDGKGWNGEMDRKIQRFLNKCQSFFSKYQAKKPTRSKIMAATIRSMDKSGYWLPRALQEKDTKKLNDLRNFFQGVSHHKILCTEEEFCIRLEQLEDFLLDRLVPRIFADFDVIDEIIKEGNIDG